ncbi:hypothetical protein HO173_009671 [Letharia columbiana]|uniref:Uncharacterized protein n=1 Tax=Letharia columbiana TaxID=112416 RepID=A0A8H6FP24_9LECA|nr:uncharacterized protein HO173_009671 [Letharia columbiana]KAF6232077.1 hypothetical protein HO173_009671 [Letharia columbiana]
MHLHTFQRPALRASILSTLLLISPCKAYVNWLYPPSSSSNALAYNYNDVVYFTWDSNFTNPSLTLWCATDDNYFALYTANVTTNGTDPQSFPYADAFNHTCHTSLYCHGSPACGPVGQSPEFALLHNNAAAAQTWGALRHGVRRQGCCRSDRHVRLVAGRGAVCGCVGDDVGCEGDGDGDDAGEWWARCGRQGGDRCRGCAGCCGGWGGAGVLRAEGAEEGEGGEDGFGWFGGAGDDERAAVYDPSGLGGAFAA